jgi:hypothetical protein
MIHKSGMKTGRSAVRSDYELKSTKTQSGRTTENGNHLGMTDCDLGGIDGCRRGEDSDGCGVQTAADLIQPC